MESKTEEKETVMYPKEYPRLNEPLIMLMRMAASCENELTFSSISSGSCTVPRFF